MQTSTKKKMLQQNLFQSYYQKNPPLNKKIHASFSKILKCSYTNLITVLSIKTLCSFVRVSSPREKKL